MNRRAKRRNKYCLNHVVKFLAHYLDITIRQRISLCGEVEVTDFRLSLWLTVDINSVLGWLYRVYVSNIADISEAHAFSIFSVEECRMGKFLCIKFLSKSHGRRGGWGWWPVWANWVNGAKKLRKDRPPNTPKDHWQLVFLTTYFSVSWCWNVDGSTCKWSYSLMHKRHNKFSSVQAHLPYIRI